MLTLLLGECRVEASAWSMLVLIVTTEQKAFLPPSIFLWMPEPIIIFQFQQTPASPCEGSIPTSEDALRPDCLEIYRL